MEFEWDEDKRERVLRERRIDFLWVVKIFEDPKRIEAKDQRRDYGEERCRTVGRIGDDVYAVVYSERPGVRRIITAWRLGRNGRRTYQALHDGTDTGDD